MEWRHPASNKAETHLEDGQNHNQAMQKLPDTVYIHIALW